MDTVQLEALLFSISAFVTALIALWRSELYWRAVRKVESLMTGEVDKAQQLNTLTNELIRTRLNDEQWRAQFDAMRAHAIQMEQKALDLETGSHSLERTYQYLLTERDAKVAQLQEQLEQEKMRTVVVKALGDEHTRLLEAELNRIKTAHGYTRREGVDRPFESLDRKGNLADEQ